MKKKYDCPFFEVQKLSIIDIICESDPSPGEGPVPEYGRGDSDEGGGAGEGGVPEYGRGDPEG